jgi:hypothetical protein
MRVLARLSVRPETTWIGVHSGKSHQRAKLLRFFDTEATPSTSMLFVPADGWAALGIRTVFLDWEGNVVIDVETRASEGEDVEDLVERLVEQGWEES